MTGFSITDKINSLQSQINILENRVEKVDLRYKQLIVLFKSLVEHGFRVRRAKQLSIDDIISFLSDLIAEHDRNIDNSEIRETEDLLGELIKKGGRE